MNRRTRPRRRSCVGIVTGAVLTAVAPLSTGAAPGDPVATFGDDGLAVVAEGRPPTFDIAGDVVRMDDGSLIVVGSAFSSQAGDLVVARVDAGRTPVPTFGTSGRLRVSRPGITLLATGIARHGTGVVVVGTAIDRTSLDEDVVVVKVTANGRLDTSFDGDGVRFIDVVDKAFFRSIAVDASSGRIALGGFDGASPQVRMLTATGSVDSSFSGDGVLPLTSVMAESSTVPLAFQSDGRLVVAGSTASVANVSDTWVARYTTAGVLDVTFDADGVRVVDLAGADDRPRALVVSGARVYVASRVGTAVGLLALHAAGPSPQGSPVAAFSGDGQVVLPTSGSASEPVDLTVVPVTGALQVASEVQNGFTRGWELTETSSAGVWNPTFATTGIFSRFLPSNSSPTAVVTDGATTTLVGTDDGDLAILDVAVDDVVSTPGSSTLHSLNLGRMSSFTELQSSTLLTDGRVISAGSVRNGVGDTGRDALVAALLPTGVIDSAFGDDGVVTFSHPGGSAMGVDVAARRGGGIAVLIGTRGPSTSGFVVHGRTADGRRDATFGDAGRRVLPLANDLEMATAGVMTVDAEGRIVVALTKGSGGAWGTTIVRLTRRGALDTTFGTGGVVDVPSTTIVYPVHVEVQPNGRVVVVDSARIVRLRSTGALDTSLDTDGVLSPVPGVTSTIAGADVQADGRVVVAASGSDSLTVVRLRPSGAPDPTLGGGSAVTVATGELFAGGVYDLVVQRDGRLAVLVLGSDASSRTAPVVWRLRYDGTRDPSFGTAGWSAIDAPGSEPVGRDLLLMPQGDMLVSGTFYDPAPHGMVARIDGGRGATCAGRSATVHLLTGERPTDGGDVVVGTPGADTVAAGRGLDIVCGLGGDDVLRGDAGPDRLLGGPGADTLVGGDGRDLCVGGPGTDSARTCERVRQVP